MTPRQIIDNAASLMLNHTEIDIGNGLVAILKGRGIHNGVKWVLFVIPELRNRALKLELNINGSCTISSGQVFTKIVSDGFNQDTPIDKILSDKLQ